MQYRNRLHADFSKIYESLLLDQISTQSEHVKLLESQIKRIAGQTGKLSEIENQLELKPNLSDLGPKDSISRLEQANRDLARELAFAQKRISSMRIDRQIMAFPGFIFRKFTPSRKVEQSQQNLASAAAKTVTPLVNASRYDVVVLCPVYPGGNRPYGGEFIQKRVSSYRQAGLSVAVLEVNPKRSDQQSHDVENVPVLRCGLKDAEAFLQNHNPKQIAVHQLERPLWDVVKTFADRIQITVWIHGFEARHWRELESNYTAEELVKLKDLLDEVTETRKATMKEVLSDRRIRKVFVSKFMQSVAEKFAEQPSINTEVIHNQILESDFPYKIKSADDRFNVLWIRSFGARNYSNDLSRDAILALSKKPFFEKMSFTIYGDGKLFEESTDPLKQFSNVSINRKFISTAEIRDMHAKHGMILVPSRWDSQGLTCGEAMASGLVPITTRIAALPEFVDETCGVVCPPDNAQALADGMAYCVENPKAFLKMSKRAGKRSAKQCGYSATVKKEIDLLKRKPITK